VLGAEEKLKALEHELSPPCANAPRRSCRGAAGAVTLARLDAEAALAEAGGALRLECGPPWTIPTASASTAPGIRWSSACCPRGAFVPTTASWTAPPARSCS